jgi:probable HAF family extracellular repeat protein
MEEKKMKSILTSIAAGSLLAAFATAQTPRYTVTDLGTFGGTFSISNGINNGGRVSGSANVPAGVGHPFLSGIAKTDLGTLGGPNAQAYGPDGKEEMAIISETSKMDPLGEDFCGFGTHLICLGAIWSGTMTALPTLGGANAMALALNNRGQLAGVAENSTKDKLCTAPQVLDFEAVIWGPGQGQIQALPTLSGDTVGFAAFINDLGQAVGSSGTCATTAVNAVGVLSGPHAVLWDNGSATDLGSLGGMMNNVATAINNRSEVVGSSDLTGDTAAHGFLWTKAAGIQDIGALGTDVAGVPIQINNNTQVVGGSCDDMGNCRAFLWQNKVMTDLNTLIPADSPLYLVFGCAINDAGEIVGQALDKSTGEIHAYLATPIPGTAASASDTPAAREAASPMPLPENVRQMLRQRLPVGRFGAQPR